MSTGVLLPASGAVEIGRRRARRAPPPSTHAKPRSTIGHAARHRGGLTGGVNTHRLGCQHLRRCLPPAGEVGGFDDAFAVACRAAAIAFVTTHVEDGARVGIGAGPMVRFALDEMHERLNDGTLKDVMVVPTGTVSAKEAAVAGVPVTDLDAVAALDVVVLQADEVVTVEDPVSPGIAAVVGEVSGGSCQIDQPFVMSCHARARRSTRLLTLLDDAVPWTRRRLTRDARMSTHRARTLSSRALAATGAARPDQDSRGD